MDPYTIGLILTLGKVLYNDEDRTFQKWYEGLKGGLSEYSFERIKRCAWSRLRKVSFELYQISFIRITDKLWSNVDHFKKILETLMGRQEGKSYC